jgi:hypothetical protein
VIFIIDKVKNLLIRFKNIFFIPKNCNKLVYSYIHGIDDKNENS